MCVCVFVCVCVCVFVCVCVCVYVCVCVCMYLYMYDVYTASVLIWNNFLSQVLGGWCQKKMTVWGDLKSSAMLNISVGGLLCFLSKRIWL